jgi:hypothetical protein
MFGSYSSWDFYAGGRDAGDNFGLGWSTGYREDYGASGHRIRTRSGYGGRPYYPGR